MFCLNEPTSRGGELSALFPTKAMYLQKIELGKTVAASDLIKAHCQKFKTMASLELDSPVKRKRKK